VDEKKAKHYYELAAMMGDTHARNTIGCIEWQTGNMNKENYKSNANIDRALKHFMIASGNGNQLSLDNIQDMYKIGQVTKDEYTAALQAYQTYLSEIKSAQRDEAAAFDDKHKYY